MAKKKGKNEKKINKWQKVFLWIFGVLGVLILAFIIGFKIWVSTWQEYRNDEFGFSFRYPKNWYISGYYDNTYGGRDVAFYVDSKKELPNSPQDPARSPGDVQVVMESDNHLFESHSRDEYIMMRQHNFGSKEGYMRTWTGKTSENLGGRYVFGKSGYVENRGYYFYINVLTLSDGKNLLSWFKAKHFHLIGSMILEGFRFD